MKKVKIPLLSLICTVIGVLLILSAAAILIIDSVDNKLNVEGAEKALIKVEEILTDITDAFPEERYNDSMPSMEIEGMDIAGIIEVPRYNVKSVINATWDKNKSLAIPCRFTGSVYNRTLIIGAGDGQFGFAKTMDDGELLYITDMEGGRYSYTVEKIEHSKSADIEKLQSGDWDMTVFVKISSSGEYLLLRCKVK